MEEPIMASNKSHARITYQPLQPPNATITNNEVRDEWLRRVCSEFVSPSQKNKEYYAVILRTLWPQNHGIPGPHVEESAIRKAINDYRGTPYVDTFRRMRELQGEEGFLGIIKGGNKYQLIHLNVSEKRVPRTHLNRSEWISVLERYNGVCAACGRTPTEKGFQQDHKIPRLRGGGDNIDNWQPLCDECNNFKSTACRDCHLNCSVCCWAFPEKYKPLQIPADVLERLRYYAKCKNRTPDDIVTALINNFLESEKQ